MTTGSVHRSGGSSPAAALTPATAFAARTRFVHFEAATTEIVAIQRGDGFAAGVIILHFHETEAAGATGLAIEKNRAIHHFAVLAEEFTDFCFG